MSQTRRSFESEREYSDNSQIERVLNDSYNDIKQVCRPQNGECGSVARAIQNVFGGEIVGMYETPEQPGLPNHVIVRLNGELVDNEGVGSMFELAQTVFVERQPRNHEPPVNMTDLKQHFISERTLPIHDAIFDSDTVSQVTTILQNNME